jgi:large subunit ribosomal protein L4
MPKIDLFDTKGKSTTKIELPKEIFGAKINRALIAQAVKVFLANQRQTGAKTKGRGEVTGSGRKIYKQKGTGRARHGDQYAPIFVGGGVAHGPTGEQNYTLKMSQQMRRKALFAALSSKLKDEQIVVVKGLDKVEPKTKAVAEVLRNLLIDGKVSLVLTGTERELMRSARNLAELKLLRAADLNTYTTLNGGKLVFLPESIDKLVEIHLKKK